MYSVCTPPMPTHPNVASVGPGGAVVESAKYHLDIANTSGDRAMTYLLLIERMAQLFADS
jgi:hypothetical protein